MSVRCEVPGGGTGWFLVSVWNEKGKLLVRKFTQAGKRLTLRLPAGCCRLQVRNYSNLNPGGVTKWLRLEPETCGSLCLLFTQPLCFPRVVPVSFTVSDANYPGITAINGGITVWRQPITP